MSYKVKLFGLFMAFFTGVSLAAPSNVESNLRVINSQIESLHHNILQKKAAQNNLGKLVSNSETAIQATNQALIKLKSQNSNSVKQLSQYQSDLVKIQQNLASLKDDLSILIKQTYKEKILLDNTQSNFLFNTDNTQRKIQSKYLQIALNNQITAYNQVSDNLNTLNIRINKLNNEITRQQQQIKSLENKKQNLEKTATTKQQEYVKIDHEISEDSKKLDKLRVQQAKITSLMQSIKKAQLAQAKKAKRAKKQRVLSFGVTSATAEVATNNDAPITKQGLSGVIRPVSGEILVKYTKKGNQRSSGVLISAVGSPVLAVANGTVVYVGKFANLGNVVVIDHGSNYMSVYSGVVPEVKMGQNVSQGTEIANSGDNDNQPMGGVYFELRHNGTPIDSNYIFANN